MRVSRKSKLVRSNVEDSENFDAEADQMEEDLLDELSECNMNDSPERHMPQTGRLRVKLHGQDAANFDNSIGEGSPEETKPTLLDTLKAPMYKKQNTQKKLHLAINRLEVFLNYISNKIKSNTFKMQIGF